MFEKGKQPSPARQRQLDRALETKIDEAVLNQLMEEIDAN